MPPFDGRPSKTGGLLLGTLQPSFVCSTSDHTPASNSTTNQPSLFRLLPLFHRGLFTLLCSHSVISHPHFLKPWMSEIPHAFQCLHSGENWWFTTGVSQHSPATIVSFSSHNEAKKKLLFLFGFHFWGRCFSSALLFGLQRMFYYVTNLRDLLLWPVCFSAAAGRS